MEHAINMHRTHPMKSDLPGLVECIDECFACAQTCTACADACLAERNVDMLMKCIRLNQDCADICLATGRVLSRETDTDWAVVRDLIQACYSVCQVCADECSQRASHHEHCDVCSQSCRKCAEACDTLLANIPVGTPF